MTEHYKGRGAQPAHDDWFDGCGKLLESQTDKEMWKVVPCTHADCNVDLIVNTFYAPAKAKCARHGDHKPAAIATSHLVHSSTPDAPSNGALAKLECPLCRNPMLVHRIDEQSGNVVLRCTEGIELTMKDIARHHEAGNSNIACGTAVVVKPGAAWAEAKGIPTALRELIEDFNIGQRVTYYDKLEANSETLPNTTTA